MQTLKNTFKDDFLIGSAVSRSLFSEKPPATLQLVSRQFSSVSSCNMLKWAPFNPSPGIFRHGPADAYVEFGVTNRMYVVGHVLFWHNQTPEWVYRHKQGARMDRNSLLARMRERVKYVADRYGSRIDAWDVVNEAILASGELRDTRWTRIVGPDFIEQAFRIADEELPEDVELLYNDYGMTGERKRDAVVKMIRGLKKKGVRIDGVGMQGHWSLDSPSKEDIETTIVSFGQTGIDVHITELDINVLPKHPRMFDGNADIKLRLEQDPALNPYKSGLPEKVQQELAERYAEIFGLFLKHSDKIKRVTFWGTTDRDSWLNNWPIRGRTNYPLLFDRNGTPKPAYQAVIDLKNG